MSPSKRTPMMILNLAFPLETWRGTWYMLMISMSSPHQPVYMVLSITLARNFGAQKLRQALLVDCKVVVSMYACSGSPSSHMPKRLIYWPLNVDIYILSSYTCVTLTHLFMFPNPFSSLIIFLLLLSTFYSIGIPARLII